MRLSFQIASKIVDLKWPPNHLGLSDFCDSLSVALLRRHIITSWHTPCHPHVNSRLHEFHKAPPLYKGTLR